MTSEEIAIRVKCAKQVLGWCNLQATEPPVDPMNATYRGIASDILAFTGVSVMTLYEEMLKGVQV